MIDEHIFIILHDEIDSYLSEPNAAVTHILSSHLGSIIDSLTDTKLKASN